MLLVVLAIIAALAVAITVQGTTALDSAITYLARWFFAIFCTLFALAQARVYYVRRRRQARLATDVPLSAFGFFTFLWFLLSAAAIIYGINGAGGWWETAAWVTVVLVICVQLAVLGGLEQRTHKTDSRELGDEGTGNQ
jgi:hypothetical protein